MKISHIQAKVRQMNSTGTQVVSEAEVLTHFLHVISNKELHIINILAIRDIIFSQVGDTQHCKILVGENSLYISDEKTRTELKQFFQVEDTCNSLLENTKDKM